MLLTFSVNAWMKPFCLVIQMKAIEHNFLVEVDLSIVCLSSSFFFAVFDFNLAVKEHSALQCT